MVDPRRLRFAAWLTTGVLAVVLVTGSAWLLAAQVVVFALGARGRNPYARLHRPSRPPLELEPAAPARFAQVVGLVFTLLGVLLLAVGATTPALIATAAALSAALLNAAFGLCLGCELYLVLKRTTNREGATA